MDEPQRQLQIKYTIAQAFTCLLAGFMLLTVRVGPTELLLQVFGILFYLSAFFILAAVIMKQRHPKVFRALQWFDDTILSAVLFPFVLFGAVVNLVSAVGQIGPGGWCSVALLSSFLVWLALLAIVLLMPALRWTRTVWVQRCKVVALSFGVAALIALKSEPVRLSVVLIGIGLLALSVAMLLEDWR